MEHLGMDFLPKAPNQGSKYQLREPMVTTRSSSKKRAAPSALLVSRKKRKGSVDDGTGNKHDAEGLFSGPIHPPFHIHTAIDQVVGQDELMDIVLSFLGARDLLNFSVTSKKHIQALTFDRVIRSAVLGGDYKARIGVERLAYLVDRRRIWTPSPLRMLRLVNGRRCESCKWAPVRLVSKSFGVFCCFWRMYCGKERWSSRIAEVGVGKKWKPYITEPRVASSGRSIWVQPTFDSSGSPIGPYATKYAMEQVMEKVRHQSKGKRNKNAADKESFGRKLLKQHLDGLIADDPYASHRHKIVSAVQACLSELYQKRKCA